MLHFSLFAVSCSYVIKMIWLNRLHANKILIAPYVMRSRAHARHRGLIAWWEGDTKREKEDERLKIASGTVLSNDRVRSRLLGKHKFDAKAVTDLKITSTRTIWQKLLWHHTETLSKHTSKVGSMVSWLKQFATRS